MGVCPQSTLSKILVGCLDASWLTPLVFPPCSTPWKSTSSDRKGERDQFSLTVGADPPHGVTVER